MSDHPTTASDDGTLDDPPAPHAIDPRSAAELCPFLASADGDWRSIVAIREHRCTAVDPVAVLSLEKQRRLCLVREHLTCSTYLAARQRLLEEEVPVGEATRDAPDGARAVIDRPLLRWAVPLTAPVVLDRGRPSIRDVLTRRSTTQLALVLLMALAFLVLALARLSTGGAAARPGPSAGPSTTAGPTAMLPAVVSAVVSSSPVPGAPARSSSGATAPAASLTVPSPSAARTYRVAAGDTLIGIATRFGVTLRSLEAANRIIDPTRLRVGTVLVIP